MKTLLILGLSVVLVLGADTGNQQGKHWALLVAGSNTWGNYRHQADVCHAYQIVHAHGVPDENIVVMMYDDIAHNKENPTPGIVINQPNGKDVYHGVPKDYTGAHVNPQVFLDVLTGKKEKLKGIGSGKVIDSGPNDHVFVNFVDHGAPGIVAFGDKYLHAKALMAAIQEMHQKKKYQKLLFYLEACESGSMFENLLPKNINVFATTASNARESSYACYFDKKRQTYLGDVYSVMWMQDSDKEDLTKETLQSQFLITKKKTNTSHVMEYGDLSINTMMVAEFLGNMTSSIVVQPNVANPYEDAVKSEDVPVAILERSLKLAKSETEKSQLQIRLNELLKERQMVRRTFESIISLVNEDTEMVNKILNGERHTIHDWDCYESALNKLVQTCPQLNIPQNDYALRHLYTLVNMCETNTSVDILHEAIDEVCRH
ncbi:hypothetical protein CHS0354_033104 [Potamilus streckersoni]|uniref:Hemoglobinase n=1 Tax=Potamilus streckersoni TaxID=2493646 RepID=A0AAE0VPN7_9BIVA|nr:hypothetical protein CHS0354_033104 [Potamilus streckersoni]